MKEESFLLVSLNEEKAKKLAQVISNETCTKILKHFSSGKDGTETEIAKALSLPLSTVHYNLKQLVDAKLVISDEYHYSEKGREVQHYRLANKYIIIAPEEEKESFSKKLKGFIPAIIVVGAVAVVMKALNLFAFKSSQLATMESSRFVGQASPDAVPTAAPALYDAASVGAEAANDAAGGTGPVMMKVASTLAENVTNATAAATQSITENVSNVAQQFAPPFVETSRHVFNWASFVSNEAILFFLGGAFLVLLILAVGMYVWKK